jgi:hypothetical protein
MAFQPQVTIESANFDQSIIGAIHETRSYNTAIQAGFTPAKYNAVAIDSDDSKLVLWDAADATHAFEGILISYNSTTGQTVLATNCSSVDINKLSIANLAANKQAAADAMREKNCTVL